VFKPRWRPLDSCPPAGRDSPRDLPNVTPRRKPLAPWSPAHFALGCATYPVVAEELSSTNRSPEGWSRRRPTPSPLCSIVLKKMVKPAVSLQRRGRARLFLGSHAGGHSSPGHGSSLAPAIWAFVDVSRSGCSPMFAPLPVATGSPPLAASSASCAPAPSHCFSLSTMPVMRRVYDLIGD